jgi:chromosome segregation ATPase
LFCIDSSTQTELSELDLHLIEVNANADNNMETLLGEITALKSQVENLQRRNEELKARLFSIDTMKSNNSAAAFYTGFQSWDAFILYIIFWTLERLART